MVRAFAKVLLQAATLFSDAGLAASWLLQWHIAS
jgi:hypothetical protein